MNEKKAVELCILQPLYNRLLIYQPSNNNDFGAAGASFGAAA